MAEVSPPNFERVNWEKAKNIFKEGRKDKDDRKKLDEFLKEQSTVQDAREACKATQKAAGNEYSAALGGILGNIDIAMSVGDLAMKSAPESIGLVWMGIRLCLHSVADDFSTFHIFGAACSDIVGILISCAVYGRMYSLPRGLESFGEIHAQVVDRIPVIYSEILDFSFSVKKYMSRNKVYRTAKGMVSSASTKFQGKVKSIRDHEAAMSEFARKAHEQLSDFYLRSGQGNQEVMMGDLTELKEKMQQSLKANQDTLQQLRVLIEERNTMKKKTPLDVEMETFEENRKLLNASGSQGEVLAAKLEKRSPPQTCTWIFKQGGYEKWRDSTESCLLWVSGGGGFGKSVLMSAIIQELKTQSSQPGAIVGFFFCNSGDDITKKTERITKYLLHQLYELAEKLPLETLQAANTSVSGFLKKGSAPSGGRGDSGKGRGEGEKEAIGFAEAFRSLAKLLKNPVFVVIDALDECADRQSEGLLKQIHDMVSDPDLGLKVLVCSRPESDIESALDGVSRIKVEDNNGPDIRLNAVTELEKLPGWSSQERDLACDRIVEKAGSYFRYVELAVEFLKQPWQRPLHKRLEQLPEGLSAFYQQILRKTDPVYVELLKTCLTWTILADGKIKVAEVIDAYSRTYVGINADYVVDDAPTTHSNPADDLHVRQIRIAGSALLEVDAKSRVIQLRHSTVGDYFLAKKSESEPSPIAEHLCDCPHCKIKKAGDPFIISESQGHLEVATTILRHLSSPTFRAKYLKPFEKQTSPPNLGNTTEDHSSPQVERDDRVLESAVTPNKTDATEKPGTPEVSTTGKLEPDSVSPLVSPLEEPASKSGADNGQEEVEAPKMNSSDQQPKAPAGEAADASQATEAPDNESDSDSDAGVQDIGGDADGDEANNPSLQFRYEVRHCHYHLRKVDELWAPEDRNSPEWNEYEDLLNSFFRDDSEAFRSWANLRAQDRTSEISDCLEDPSSVRPLHSAAAHGLINVVIRMIERGDDLSAQTVGGCQPLHYAAYYYGEMPDRGLKLLKLLLEKGANPNAQGIRESPLHTLVWMNPQLDAVRLFLDHGADVTVKDPWNDSVLHNFAWQGKKDEVLRELIAVGADVNAKAEMEQTPLHILMRLQDPPTDILKAFIEGGADVNSEDTLSQMPLYLVCEQGNTEAARLLIDAGANVYDDNLDGMTAAHVAALNGHRDILWLLLEKGARVSQADNRGRTPFYLACQSESEETAISLINGLDPKDHNVFTQPSTDGKTPLRKAAARGHRKVVEMLLDKVDISSSLGSQDSKLKQTPLHAAVSNGHKPVVELLLRFQTAIDIVDKAGNTPLLSCFDGWEASKSADYEAIALLLIDKDPSAAAAANDSVLLNGAAMKGTLDVVMKLLDVGADPMQQDEHGWTSLQIARQYGRTEVAELISKHRAVVGLRPSCFKNTIPDLMRVSSDGLEVEQLQPAKHRCSVLSDHPIPAGVNTFYYEITIHNPEDKDSYPIVAIGFSSQVNRLKGWLPGWYIPNPNASSWAYHGDDGGMYSHRPDIPDKNTPTCERFGHGVTIGCGIDFQKAAIFFTRNGNLLSVTRGGAQPTYFAHSNVGGRLHPALGMGSSKSIAQANFGGDLLEMPFKWEPANDGSFNIEALIKAEEAGAKGAELEKHQSVEAKLAHGAEEPGPESLSETNVHAGSC